MAADLLSQLFRSRVGVLRGALNGPRDDNGEERKRSVAILYELLMESPGEIERLYRSMWGHATSGTLDPVEIGNDLFAQWDTALDVLRQAQPQIEAAERSGDLAAGSADRLAGIIRLLAEERDKAAARWLWLTPADADAAEAAHARGETIPNEDLLGELQCRLAATGARKGS